MPDDGGHVQHGITYLAGVGAAGGAAQPVPGLRDSPGHDSTSPGGRDRTGQDRTGQDGLT